MVVLATRHGITNATSRRLLLGIATVVLGAGVTLFMCTKVAADGAAALTLDGHIVDKDGTYFLDAGCQTLYELESQSLGKEHDGQYVTIVGDVVNNKLRVTSLSGPKVKLPRSASCYEILGDAADAHRDLREALSRYLQAFNVAQVDQATRLREKIIKVVLQLNPPPAIPQDAIRHAAYAQAAVEEAQKDAKPSHLNDAVNETEEALRLAPWWAQGYFSLAALLEKTNRPGEAANALQLYLLADPQAVLAQKNGMNAQDVQVKIYKLQYEAKQQ